MLAPPLKAYSRPRKFVFLMKIFYLAHRVPYPPDRGDKIRTYHEVRYLARDHEVHVFCLADGAEDLNNVAGIKDIAASVSVVPVSRVKARVRALLALLFGKPFSVGFFNEVKLHDLIRDSLERVDPDFALVYSSGMAQYVQGLDGLPVIMEFGDLDSLKWAQYGERGYPPMKWIYATEARRLLNYEREIAYSVRHSIVCTAREQDDFERLIPEAAVSCVGNGVDLEFFAPRNTAKTAAALVFTGVMDYLPNVDAVIWFCEHILPIVQKRVPNATFTICGSKPTKEVQALASKQGVTVTGWVEDVRPFLDAAEVAVVPVRIARGIQNKLLEAMAMRLPCVAATAAWTGIEVSGESGVAVTDDADQFADEVCRLLSDTALRESKAAAARSAVERHYSWNAQLSRLDDIFSREVS